MNEILDKILNVSNVKLNFLNLNYINTYIFHHNMFNHHPEYYFNRKVGDEHYRLLTFISTLYNNEILFDIGTYRCMSATALSFNKKNKIKSYDIVKAIPYPVIPNIEFIIGNVIKDIDLIKSPFIFLDTAHDGIFENEFYNHLHKIKWEGLLMLDDIYENNEMKDFWKNISEEKYDISNIGHHSGTGICLFE